MPNDLKDEKINKQVTLTDLIDAAKHSENDNTLFDLEEFVDLLREEKQSKEQQLKEKEEKKRLEREESERRQKHIEEVTCMDLPLDWDNIFDSDERTRGVHTESISDALILSLATLGHVDIEYISSVTDADYKAVICTLKGSIYQNPDTWDECFYKGWETAEEYLSGNIVRKWRTAQKANRKYKGYFSDNLKALEKVIPPAITSKEIYVTLGSPWVPADIIDDFIKRLLGDPFESTHWFGVNKFARERYMSFFKTKHDEITGSWEIPHKSRYNHSVAVSKTYGTARLEALHIIERTLNMKAVAVYEEVDCPANASGKNGS